MKVLRDVWPVTVLSLSVAMSAPSPVRAQVIANGIVTPIQFGFFAVGPDQEAILSLTNTGPNTLSVEIVVRDEAGAIVTQQAGTLTPGEPGPKSGYVFSLNVGGQTTGGSSHFTWTGNVMGRHRLAAAVVPTLVIIDKQTQNVVSVVRAPVRR